MPPGQAPLDTTTSLLRRREVLFAGGAGLFAIPVVAALVQSDDGGASPSTAFAGLFTDIPTSEIPAGTTAIRTTGHGSNGVGAARYRIGAEGEPKAPETYHSTNTLNGRPVYLDEAEPTILMFGASPARRDNSPQLQAAFDYGASAGRKIRGVPGVFGCLSILTFPGGLNLEGPGFDFRIEKRFSTGMASVLAQTTRTVVGDRNEGITNLRIVGVEFGASGYFIGGAKAGKILNIVGRNVHLERIRIKTWHGWGLTINGFGVTARDIHFDDPYDPGSGVVNGVDGLHIGFGEDIEVDGVHGVSADDFVAIFAAEAGTNSNRDARRITIRNVRGRSIYARTVGLGVWDKRLTNTVEDILVDGVYNDEPGGQIGIFNIGTGSTVRNVTVQNFRLRCDPSKTKLGIRLLGGENIRLLNGSVSGASKTQLYIQSYPAGMRNIELDLALDGSGASGNTAHVHADAPSSGIRGRLRVVAGEGDGVFLAPDLRPERAITDCDLDIAVSGVKSGKRGLVVGNVRNSRFNITAAETPGAVGSIGVQESLAGGNSFMGDLREVDVKVARPKPSSTYRIAGFTPPALS